MLNQRKKFSTKLLFAGMLVCVWANGAWAQTARQSEPRFTALSAEPGKPSVYEIAFVAREALTSEAEFVLEFPYEFDLSLLQIAGSPDMTGGFTLTRDKQKVRVKRSGLGQSVVAGTFVRLRLGVIINPKSFENSTAITLQIRLAPQSALMALAQQRVIFQPMEKHE